MGRARDLAGMTRGVAAVILVAIAAAGCKREDVRAFEGVAEVEMVRLTAPQAGNLASLSVQPGARVSEGAPVFSVVDPQDVDAHRDAEERLARLERMQNGAQDIRALESLRTEVAQTQWRLSQKSASAPVNGVVVETLFSKGDWVPAGAPVVAILPVDKVKVRFSVPLDVAAHLQHGRSVKLVCEGCAGPIDANVTYVSPFALGDGDKDPQSLQYAVEARPRPEQAELLRPGVSVTVIL